MFSNINLTKIADPKAILRLHAKKLREELLAKRPDAGLHAAAQFMRALDPQQGGVVAVYCPVGSELDTWPLVEELLQHQCRVALPVVLAKNAPLIFREYTLDTVLINGEFGIQVPPEEEAELIPEIVVCPLLAFTSNGTRLGMGGGFYDRTLNALREQYQLTAVGYAFAGQENKNLKAEKHDEMLDWIITERSAVKV